MTKTAITSNTFAGNMLAFGRTGGAAQRITGLRYEFVGTEVVGYVERDGQWQAYVIDDSQRDEFRRWARDLWVDADGNFDATLRFDPVGDWDA